jgi:4-amino-4-deoxy-L-arabinose transferase-like glycosyltransferase
MKKLFYTILPVLLVGLFMALSAASSLSESLTFDELVHSQEGINALTKHTFLIDTNNPPLIRELAMLPVVLGGGKLFPARFVIILLGALTLIAVYRVTKRYFGRTQALFALFLLALEPTLLGHSHYVTLDIGVTLFFFIGYMAFVRLMERYSFSRLGVAAIAWGAAFASKMTAIPFLLISAFVAGAGIFKDSVRRFWTRPIRFVIFASLVALMIWATYFLMPFGNYLAVIKNTLVRTGATPKIFFLGHFYPSARWYFMGNTFLLKIPIPLLLLFVLGLFAGRRPRDRKSIAVFAIPVFVVLGISSLVNIQPWVRYVLPAVPFFVIVASESMRLISGSVRKILFLLFCLWYAYGTGLAFPHYISYANELAGPAQSRYRIFTDSNLDWGQSLPDIARYIEKTQPGYVSFSYFGRDNGDVYGLTSDMAYGSHRYEDICAFHHINLPYTSPNIMVAISVSNWYYCKYNVDPRFSGRPVKAVVGGSILIL